MNNMISDKKIRIRFDTMSVGNGFCDVVFIQK